MARLRPAALLPTSARTALAAGLALALVATGPVPLAKGAEPGTVERLSVAGGRPGSERNRIETGSTTGCAATTVGKCTKRTVASIPGGYRVVFTSSAPNLVDGDTNGAADVFVADVLNNTVTTVRRVSLTGAGDQADGDSEGGTISANGVWVAFESRATNLAEGDNKLAADVFVRNLGSDQLYLASRATGPDGQPGNQTSFSPSVADDGTVSFTSFATNLVSSNLVSSFQAVYARRDPAGAATTVPVSIGDDNAPADGPALESNISGNGRFVAFTSGARNLGGGAAEAVSDEDVFVRDLVSATTKRITRGALAFAASINGDGTKVAYAAERLDSDLRKDVFVSDVSAGENSGSNRSDCGASCATAGQDRPAVAPSIADGGAVAFQSAARFPGETVTSEQVWTSGGSIAMASKAPGGANPDGVSEFASISPDGAVVAFTSRAANLVPGDTNGAPDVFLRTADGTILRVSVRPPGTEASGFAAVPTSAPVLSGDGGLAVFESDSTNLVAGDENGLADIFLRDRAAGTTRRISVGPGGAEANGASRHPDVSADGRYIVFESTASNLVADDTNSVSDVFLYDRAAGSLRRISVSDSGFESTGVSGRPAISANGRWVAFESLGSLAPPVAAADSVQVFRFDLTAGTITRVSLGYPGSGGTRRVPSRDSFAPDVADTGAVAFLSEARNLTEREECSPSSSPPCDESSPDYQAPNRTDVFVMLPDMSIVRVNRATGGKLANGDSTHPVISADGRRVAFSSGAGNLAPDANTDADVFVADVAGGPVRLVSGGLNGATPTGRSSWPAINADGSLIAFVSNAGNLVAGDTNGRADVFLASPGAVTRRISVRFDGTEANAESFTPALAHGGAAVAFHSSADNLVPGDANGTFDAFVRDLLDSDRPVPCFSACSGGGGGLANNSGYRFVAADGGIFSFDAQFFGSMGDQRLNRPIVGMATTPDNAGYRLVASDGGIFSFGNARFVGSTGDVALRSPIVGISATPTGNGYWLVAADGGVFSFGDAAFFGSMGGLPLNRPIVGMAPTLSGEGYWLVAADGGIFAFGDAGFYGSTGNLRLNRPIVGLDRSVSGEGYRFVASDGGIFAFGDARFLGSSGDVKLNRPIVGMATARTGDGYWLVASDGGIFAFGDAGFLGSTGDVRLNSPIVGMAG